MVERHIYYGDNLWRIVNDERLVDDPRRVVVGIGCRACPFYVSSEVGVGAYGWVGTHSVERHSDLLIATYTRPRNDQRGWFAQLLFGPLPATIQCDKCYAILDGQIHVCPQ